MCPTKFLQIYLQTQNVVYLNGKNVLYPKTEISWDFLQENLDNYAYMRQYLKEKL